MKHKEGYGKRILLNLGPKESGVGVAKVKGSRGQGESGMCQEQGDTQSGWRVSCKETAIWLSKFI